MRRTVAGLALSLLATVAAVVPGAASAAGAPTRTTAATAAPATAAAATSASADPDTVPSGWRPREPRYGVHTRRDVAVRMSDGVVLRADVHRPATTSGEPAPGRFPVILTQNPYNKNAAVMGNDYLVSRGYVHVDVDVRGTGSSGGSWDSFGTREQRDGFELVRWAHSERRPWSDGRVGLWGISYMAINQFLTAAQHPPGLKAMFPVVPAGDVYRDVVASGGQVDVGFIPLWLGLVTGTGVLPPAYTGVAPDEGLLTLLQHVGGAAAFQLPTVVSAMAGGRMAYDNPFYRERSPLSVVDRVRVPTFVVGGHYDIFQRGESMLYERLRANGVPSRLLIGPWTHLQATSGPGLPADGIPSLDALALRWFDKHLRAVRDRALRRDVKPVSYYEIGSGRWRTARSWLPQDASARAFHLAGTAVPGAPGTLQRRPADVAGEDRVLPVPVAGLCTRSASQWTAGILSGTPCERDNRLNDQAGTSWETAPLRRPLRIAGPVNARLFVSTTARDGMLSVHVEDVAPDGSVDRLTGGWQVLSHRASVRRKARVLDGEVLQPWHPFTRRAERAVEPGKVMRVDVEVFPTGAVIAPGHRLRVTVQAFDTPHLFPTAPQAVNQLGGVISVHHAPQQRSRLVLPVRR